MSLQFAIIGCGNIGRHHADHIQIVGRLAAVYDNANVISPGKKYNSKIYFSIEEQLAIQKDIVVVAVCTHNSLHATHYNQPLKKLNTDFISLTIEV